VALRDKTALGMSLPHHSPDLLALTTIGTVARRAEELGFRDLWVTENTVDEGTTPAFHTRFGNHLALAALSVPIDVTAAGLPSSLQIVVRRFDDPLALRIGRAFEKVRGQFPVPPEV